MSRGVATALALFFLSTLAFAAGEGGADYGLPFTAAAALNDAGASNPLATASVVELTGEDLVAMGAETAADGLSLAAGCFVVQADRWNDRGEQLLLVRGAGPAGLQVLLDGVPLEHGRYGTFDLSSIPASQIARIRIFSGPAPVGYGAEGGEGVVEIVTRKPGDQLCAGFEARFGDDRRNDFSAGVGDTIRAFQFFASASHQNLSAEPLTQGFRRTSEQEGHARDDSAYTRDNFRVRLGAVVADKFEAHTSLFYDAQDREIPVNAYQPSTQFPDFPMLDRIGGALNVRLGAFGPFNLDGEAYLVHFLEDEHIYSDPRYVHLSNDEHYSDKRFGGAVAPWFDAGPISRVALRFDARTDEGDYWRPNARDEKFLIERESGSLVDDLHPLSWLNVSLGGGYMRLDPSRTDTLTPGPAVDGWHGRGGLAFGPFAGVTIRAAAGRNPRFPTVEEWFDETYGDAHLKPGVIENGEAGVDWQPAAGTKISLVGFWRREIDDIELVPRPTAGQPPVFANQDNEDGRGGTLTVASRPIEGLFLGANGSYESFVDDNTKKTFRAQYQPTWWGSGDIRYRFPFGLGAAAQLLFAGPRQELLATGLQNMAAYTVTNLRIFYTYRDLVEVYAQAQNVFDEAYETKRYFPEPGRVLTGGLRLMY